MRHIGDVPVIDPVCLLDLGSRLAADEQPPRGRIFGVAPCTDINRMGGQTLPGLRVAVGALRSPIFGRFDMET